MSMFSRCSTEVASTSLPSEETAPASSSASRSATAFTNLRIATTGPSTDAGGIIAWSLEPSSRRASTAGEALSIRSPSGAIRRRTIEMTSSSLRNATSVLSRFPPRSTHTSSYLFTRMSVTRMSWARCSSGPRPTIASTALATAPGPARGATSPTICSPARSRWSLSMS